MDFILIFLGMLSDFVMNMGLLIVINSAVAKTCFSKGMVDLSPKECEFEFTNMLTLEILKEILLVIMISMGLMVIKFFFGGCKY